MNAQSLASVIEFRAPAAASATKRVRVGSVDIAYDVRGAGEAILLLPGVTMGRFMWPDNLCDALAEAGFLVVRMDNRDSGESSRVRARPPNVLAAFGKSALGRPIDVPYRLEDMAEDAFGVMRELGHERFHVGGASMGGMIAQTMAILHPERLYSLTSVMSGPGGRRNSIGKPSGLRALLTPVPREREAHIEHLVNTFRVLGGGGLPFDEAAARVLATAQADGNPSPAASARQLGAIVESAGRRRALLRNVTTPTLVIHGSHDPLLPLRGAKATARYIRGAELLVVEGMGHDFPPSVSPLIAGAIATHARKARQAKRKPATIDLPRAARAVRALIENPDDLPQVFVVIGALSGQRVLHRFHAGFKNSETGRRLLATRPDIVTILGDRERLRAMPAGSLGRAYLDFVESENISAAGIREASESVRLLEATEAELEYVRERLRDTHDLWHAATGYGGDVLGELGLLGFIIAQQFNPGIAVILFAAVLKGMGHRYGVIDQIREGYRRGKAAAWLPPQDWEALLERPVDEVRRELRLGAPPSYTPVRSTELRAMGVVG